MEQLYEHKKKAVPRVCQRVARGFLPLFFRTIAFSAENAYIIKCIETTISD
jgi:hypothetical protein